MAAKLYKFRIQFQDDKEYNGICPGNIGQGTYPDGMDEYIIPRGTDITLGYSIFPLHVTSTPFNWSAYDIDGTLWTYSVTMDGDNTVHNFTYGIRTYTYTFSRGSVFGGTGIYLFPILQCFYSGFHIAWIIYKEMVYLGELEATCIDGAVSSGTDVYTISQLRNYYETSTSADIFSVVDIKSAGATRYIVDIKSGRAPVRFNELGRNAIIFTRSGSSGELTPLQAISYSEYDPTKDITGGTLNLAPRIFYYDGEEHLPAASLVDRNGNLLRNGTDYTVSYSPDNINVGEKIALAIGIGEYTGEVQAYWYIVADTDISGYTLNIVPKQIKFTGSSVEPLVTLYDRSGNLLTPNIDYTLTLGPDTVTVGEKYARCDGIGNYTGTIQGTWAIVDDINDPYSPGGTTVPSTGPTDGNWELPEDDLAVGGSPFNDLATQLYRPYAMTAAQVASFSNQLWNTDILDIISRYFEKPTEVVISLMSFPFTIQCENSEQINFNWISSWSSVYVLGHPITQEIQTLDFGYVDLERYSGLFYDYQPYSSVQLYLPYIGFVPLKMNEVVGKRIRLTYLVDVLSGDFTAVVETSALGTPEPEKTLPYIGFYQGNIARPMPLSQQDLFSLFKKGTEIAITGAVAATAGTVGAIEGLAAEKAVGEAVQFTEQGLPQAAEMATGRAAVSQAQSQSAYKTFKRFGAATAANSILSIGNASAPILRNGTIDGISGRTSGQEAFIVITVPNQNVPENQRILGYPTNQPGPLSKFSGYTEVRDIRLKIPNATESEIAEIESIVRGGIVI